MLYNTLNRKNFGVKIVETKTHFTAQELIGEYWVDLDDWGEPSEPYKFDTYEGMKTFLTRHVVTFKETRIVKVTTSYEVME